MEDIEIDNATDLRSRPMIKASTEGQRNKRDQILLGMGCVEKG